MKSDMPNIYRVIGLMSGTSMDGVDGVILETDGKNHIETLATASLLYEKDFTLALKQQTEEKIDPAVVELSTEYHASIVQTLLEKLPQKQKVDLIGYHGQTIYHNPLMRKTIQIGYPEKLANQFNIPVVTDFRSKDMLEGGQGAPLAPLYHHAKMCQKKWDNLIMVNCGGIANVSILTSHHVIAGYDTGPGNVLLDKFVRTWTNEEYLMDKNGEFGKKGIIDKDFIKILFKKTSKNNFYQQSPPKSLDSQDIFFIDEIMERFPRGLHQHLYDGCATLAAFTGCSIVENVKNVINLSDYTLWVIGGGGAKNPCMLEGISGLLPKGVKVRTADEVGFSGTYLEAELIAWLSVRCIKHLPLTLPQTTGVKRPMTGGKVIVPN